MSQTTMMDGFYRVCTKIYGPEPVGIPDDAEAFVPIFHEWIRAKVFDAVLFDVADYAHVPDGPGIMLVTHEAAFALDRSDYRFGLLAQRRTSIEGDGVTAIVRTVRLMLEVAAKLQTDPRLAGKLSFDRSTIRVESNDRLRAPNTDEGAIAFEPLVRRALEQVFPGGVASIRRVTSEPRDRLALDVTLQTGTESKEHMAA
jgi:hypothetical protein